MALQKQNISVPLGMGIDTKSDPKKLQPPKHAVVQDFDFDSVGQLVQRPGATKLTKSTITQAGGDGGDLADADALYTANDRLVLRSQAETHAYAGSSLNKWISTATPALLNYEKKVLASGLFPQSSGAFHSTGTYDCIAYFFKTSGGSQLVMFEVLDRETQARIAYTTSSATSAVHVDIIQYGTTVAFFYTHSGVLNYRTFDTTTRIFGGTTAVVAVLNSQFSVYAWRDSYVAVAYEDGTSALKLGLLAVPLTGAFSVAAVTVAVTNPCEMHLHVVQGAAFANDLIYLFAGGGPSAPRLPYYAVYTTGLVAVLAATQYGGGTLRGGHVAVSTSGTGVSVLSAGERREEQSTITARDPLLLTISNTGALTTETSPLPKRSGIAAINVSFLGERYIALYDTYSGNYIMTKSDCAIPAASFGEGAALYPIGRPVVSATSIEFAGLEKVRAVSQAAALSAWLVEYRLVKYVFTYDPLKAGSSVEHGKSSIMAGPCILSHDGVSTVELGFLEQPPAPSMAATAGTGIAAGTYSYCLVYEWYDRNGNLHRSAPSTPASITTGATSEYITVTCQAVGATAKDNQFFGSTNSGSPVTAAIYRTVTNGTTYYLVGATAVDTIATATSTFQDRLTDAEAQSGALLYTTGGVLESGPPPATTYVCKHQSRIHAIDADDPNQSLYTKYLAEATAPEFNEDLVMRWDQGKGGLKALASLDEKLIGLKEDSLYFVMGDGPTDTGEQNTFTLPQPIQCDTGVSEVRSVLSFPGGVIFKTVRGWYMLDRALQVNYIGAEVQKFNSLTVAGAVIVAHRNQVRVMHTEGTTLVFDYIGKQWAVNSGQAAKSCVVWDNQHTYAKSNGDVLVQEPDQWLEDTTEIEPRLVTGWFALSGIQGYQRIYEAIIMGELRSRHSIRVRVGYDQDPNWKETFTLESTAAGVTDNLTDESYYGSTEELGGAPDKTLQYKIKPYLQKCSSIRFEITLLNTQNANAELARLSEITLVVGTKAGTKRLGVGRVMT